MTTTYYSVQVLEDGLPQRVPHTKDKRGTYCEFLDRKGAIKFLKDLKENHPEEQFRILKRVEKYIPEKWE